MTTTCVIAAALVLFVSMAYVIVRLIEQRDNAAANWADEVFANAGLRHENQQLAADYDAIVARLAEVLDEHASCPVPVVAS